MKDYGKVFGTDWGRVWPDRNGQKLQTMLSQWRATTQMGMPKDACRIIRWTTWRLNITAYGNNDFEKDPDGHDEGAVGRYSDGCIMVRTIENIFW